MAQKRLQVGFTVPQHKLLEKLAAKLGLDKNNTIRYCVARIAEQELAPRDRSSAADSSR